MLKHRFVGTAREAWATRSLIPYTVDSAMNGAAASPPSSSRASSESCCMAVDRFLEVSDLN